MKVILRLRATKHLTEQQVLTAGRFRRDPNRFRLAPTGFRLLHDAIVKERPLEEIEQTRGWAARSAKVVLSVLLNMIEETEGVFWCEELDGSAEEMVAYLKGEDDHELLEIQRRLGLAPMPARILQILTHAHGPVSRETILRRLESGRLQNVSADAIDVHMVRIRKALPRDLTIRTHWGFGYELARSADGHGTANSTAQTSTDRQD
jgi:DNA-binding winged helix-turn-helix (wHTH) protein